MKYVVVLGDGMADEPIPEIGGRTPLEDARTPAMDALASVSEIGLVQTIPEGMKPGSDTANLSVLGYDPKIYYSGRSPLEALSIGVPMEDTDIALRCNLVTLAGEGAYEELTITDHSASEISTEDAAKLLEGGPPGDGERGISVLCGNQLPPLPDLERRQGAGADRAPRRAGKQNQKLSAPGGGAAPDAGAQLRDSEGSSH